MTNLIWINQAKYIGDYSLLLTFNDGVQKTVDLCQVVNNPDSIFATLSNKESFKNFELDGWTVTWNNGALDIAPERLYEVGKTLLA